MAQALGGASPGSGRESLRPKAAVPPAARSGDRARPDAAQAPRRSPRTPRGDDSHRAAAPGAVGRGRVRRRKRPLSGPRESRGARRREWLPVRRADRRPHCTGFRRRYTVTTHASDTSQRRSPVHGLLCDERARRRFSGETRASRRNPGTSPPERRPLASMQPPVFTAAVEPHGGIHALLWRRLGEMAYPELSASDSRARPGRPLGGGTCRQAIS